MDRTSAAQQVWIFVSENDQWQHRPLYLAILDLLRREGIAGATALHGLAGYGARGQIHTAALVELSSDLPVVITCIDRAERIERVLPQLTAMVQVGLISTTPAVVVAAGHRAPSAFPAHLTVADVMTRDVAHIQPETPVRAIVTLLIDRALRALPVVGSDGRVVGIITDGDLLTRGAMDLSIGIQQALPLPERAAHVASLADRPQRAADLMTPDPVTLTSSTGLAHAAAVMANRNLKRLPVVDEQGHLVGMISRSDLLKTVVEGLRQRPSEPLHLPAGAPAEISAIMMTDVPTVHRDTPLAETLDRLLETEKRRVVVVDDAGHVVGIITDGDIIRRAARRARPGTLRAWLAWLSRGEYLEGLEVAAQGRTAGDVMTTPVITVTSSTPIAEAIRLMIAHRVKRLPVRDQDGRLIGLVGRAGLLAALGHQRDNPAHDSG